MKEDEKNETSKSKAEPRQIIKGLSPEKIRLWADREIKSAADKSAKAYPWMPEEAAKEKSPLDYAKKVMQ